MYYQIYLLVVQIDHDLQRGTRHYRDSSGRLLTDLYQVISAILSDNLNVA